MANKTVTRDLIAGLCLADVDRFSVTLVEAVNFKNPYAINKAFSQVGALDTLKQYSLGFDTNYSFLKLDKETRKRVLAFAEIYNKISPNIRLDGMKIDRAIKRNDSSAIEKEYSKFLNEFVSNKIMQKIAPNILKAYCYEPRKDQIKNFLYGMIAVTDTSRWQEFLVSQLGSGQYDQQKLSNFYDSFMGEYFNNVSLPNRDERVKEYKKFLVSNKTYDYVDARVDKYAELILDKYRKDYGKGASLTQITEFIKENKELITRNFGSLINFLDEEYVRYNFLIPVLDKFKEYVLEHSIQKTEESPTKPLQELLKNVVGGIINNTPQKAEKPTFESLVERANAKVDVKVKPFVLKKTNVNFGDNDVLDYVQEQVDSVSTNTYMDNLDKKFISRNKRKLISMFVNSEYSDEEAVKNIAKIANIDRTL